MRIINQAAWIGIFLCACGAAVLAAPPAVPGPPEARPPAPTGETDPRPVPIELSREGFSLADLEAVALAHNPTLVQAAMRVRAARWQCVQAGLYPNPEAGYTAEEMNDAGTAGKQGAEFSQEILTADKRRLRSRSATWRAQQAMHDWEAQRHRVLNDVRTLFYGVLVAQRMVALEKRLVEVAEKFLVASQQLVDAKEASRVDLMQARIESNSARVSLADAENRLRAAWRRLAAAVGQPEMQMVPLGGNLDEELPELSFDEAWRRLVAESPELQRAEAAVQEAGWEYRHQRAERIPNVNVGASVHYDNVGQGTVAGVGIGLPLPLFDRNQGNIGSAQAEIVVARREVQRVRLALRQRFSDAFERYANAHQEARRYRRDILPDAEQSLELVETGYRRGEIDFLTVLTAQRTYFRVNLKYLRSLEDLWTSAVAIEGMLLSGGLDAPRP